MLAMLRIVLGMALQNILLHRIKSLVVGGILFFGSLILCVGLNLTRSVERSMAESIQGSVGADFQIYDKQARDKLALFGGAFFGREELGSIQDWTTVADSVSKIDGVKAVVPMGFENGFLGRGNDFDNLFQKLREFTRLAGAPATGQAGSAGDDSSQESQSVALREHIELTRKNLMVLKSDLENELAITSDKPTTVGRIATVEHAASEEFWTQFLKHLANSPEELESDLIYLDTRVAPLAGDKAPVYLRYMGTEIDLFAKSFSRFMISAGSLEPGQTNWILLPERFYETEIKNIAASSFDKIVETMRTQGLTPENSPELASLIGQLPNQYLQLVFAIPPAARAELTPKLAEHLGIPDETAFEELVRQFLTIDSSNALRRADWFAENIAPVAKLHEIEVGETLYMRGYTRTGFLKTLPLKVAGIYSFKGLQRSDLAGSTAIVSLESYRELYGVMSASNRKELDELTRSVSVSGARVIDQGGSIEDALFGDTSANSTASSADPLPASQPETTAETITETETEAKTETKSDQMAINLAVILTDRSLARGFKQKIEKQLNDSGFDLQVVDWKTASGLVGQLVTALTAVLLVSVFVILVVGAAIINNSLMMSTLERTREIGTLRAIGASRGLVTGLFLSEILVLAAIAVYSGALVSIAINIYLNKVGIPAGGDFVVFLFSGPRLFPFVAPIEPFLAATTLLIVSVISSAFPARFASRIQPAVAMQEKE
jgi:ABC-type lipoprotein release transport system permease subunit